MSSPLDSAVTLEEVIAIVGAKRVPMAAELAGYLALEIVEAAKRSPGVIDPARTYIGEEGSVAVVRGAGDEDVDVSVRKILGQLLSAGGSQTPALATAAAKTGGGSLSEELEAALIPLNRSAGRRALARLSREVRRVTMGIGRNASIPASERGPRSSAPSFTNEAPTRPATAQADVLSTVMHEPASEARPNARPRSVPPAESSDVDDLLMDRQKDDVDELLSSFGVSGPKDEAAHGRALKGVVGVDPTPPPPTQPFTLPDDDDASVDALLSGSTETPPPASAPAASAAPVSPPRSAPIASPTSSVRRDGPTSTIPPPRNSKGIGLSRERRIPPATGSLPNTDLITGSTTKSASRIDRILISVLLILLVAACVLVWKLQPGFISGRTKEVVDRERAEASQKPVPVKVCKAQVRVRDIPKDAEVLLRKGQAPFDIGGLPSGVRLEFVATAEGYAPKRTVITAQAWEKGPDGKPRAEVPVQLEKTRARAGTVDSWPPGEPGSEIGGKGAPGTVHVVSSPRGAEIWLVVGLGPEAVVDSLPCGGDIEVLAAGPGSYRKRITIKEADFTTNGDQRTASISAK